MATPASQDFESAELAYGRVQPELEALSVDELATINVDLLSATSIVLGVADRLLAYRERLAGLPEFDVKHVDKLTDYAKATWYAYITNLPAPEPREAATLLQEVFDLRAKLLMWSAPLVGAGKFDQAAIDRIKEGAGHKDAASDVVALVQLYRAKWDEVKGMCGVSEQDLARGAEIGPATFALLSRRDYQSTAAQSDGALRVRRSWTLLDRAYSQCRRALAYLRYEEGDADVIAPSLRRNAGTRAPSGSAQPEQPPATPTPSNGSALPPAGAPIGAGTGPFSGN